MSPSIFAGEEHLQRRKKAMTAGKPVITSHFTPWHHLKENNAGINVSIIAKEIQSAVDFFAGEDDETLQTWSKAARDFALKSVDIDDIKRQYMEMFSSIKGAV